MRFNLGPTVFLAGLALVATGTLPRVASAQPLPERVAIGEGHMTVGFELKTTDKGNGPNGRTSSHTLMDYIVPRSDIIWPEAERAEVERWGSMSRAERTAFFFKAYRGGYTSNNFVVDVARFPFLDKAVSWYGESLKIPHIEIRSAPFDSPREAHEAMTRFKATVPETIAFHMHLRFPDTGMAGRAEAMAEYLRRTSNAIWLRRADYSSKTDFVLKQADNQPMNPSEVLNALKKLENGSQGEIVGRRGLRVNRMRGPNGESLIDVEFRGLMKDTGRLERYLRATANAFAEGGEVGPWRFNEASPFRNPEHSLDVALSRTSNWSPTHLDAFAREIAAANERYGVSTSLNPEELAREVKRLATADTEAGKRTLLPSSFNWLFQPIEYDPALPEGIQEEIEKKKRTYLRKLLALAERNAAGEFGRGADYRPIAVASRARRILHDFVNETYTDGNKTRKLFEWYETSLFEPREIEERTERWRTETGRNRAEEYRAARAERAAAAEAARAAEAEARNNNRGETEGFGRRRADAERATPYEHRYNWWNHNDVRAEFEAVRAGMLERLNERIAESTTPAERAELERGRALVERTGLNVIRSPDLFAEVKLGTLFDPNRHEVRISTGAMNEVLDATRWAGGDRKANARRVLGLIFGHELAHVAGVRAEGVADREGVRALENARGPVSDTVIRSAVAVFDRPLGVSHWNNLINRLKSFVRYGTPRGRVANMERAARGEADPLAEFRRADGTLDWRRLGAARARAEGAALGQFAMALFLKELAVVAQTGDRARIEEFFDGLMTTDFYKHYGLFVVGARVGDVAYSKYLQKYIRPTFVNSLLKTNVLLAAGLALPQIAEGTFTGKAFAISLGSLGLSSAAVKSGVAGLKWVYDLKTAKPATLSSLGLRRVARFGGWFYHAAELAVVLYLAEEIEERVHAHLDERAARAALGDAGEAFFGEVASEGADAESLAAAAEAYHDAWIDYRDHLYAPLNQDEALFNARMERAARRAKQIDDRRAAAIERLETRPALRERAITEHGSLEAYADALVASDSADLDGDVAEFAASYDRSRNEHLAEIYDENRRDGSFFRDLDPTELAWAVNGGDPSAADAPGAGRTDLFSRLGRDRVLDRFHSALGDRASDNRLQAYDDELAAFSAARAGLLATGRGDLAAVFADVEARVARTKAMDDALIHGEGGLIVAPSQAGGAAEAVDALGRD
jgi:hypothetical protein